MSRRVHYRTEQIGLRLVHHLAPAVTTALADLQRQQSACDGWPPKGDTVGRGGGPTVYVEADDYEDAGRIPVTGVEAVAFTADTYGGRLQQITDTIESIEISVGHLARLVIGIDRTPAAGEAKRCSDGQKGKDALLWSDDEACMALPVKKDMCQRHYSAWRRHLESRHIDTAHHFESG